MLETKNLTKVYKPKKGVPVVALDKVSLKFPEKGMVFLLGKSGSGKSTLLNLLGGLDKYDSGEIIIKGQTSKSFNQKYFDSYRNTYVGFIFQEYNLLNEFSVGANIALAIELQGRKATDKEVNDILQEVDLQGFGNRKPNELSGGQKQRVAIARALIKNPQIIMADEPTGALDSNTGKQIFDTLKKLSQQKLVIIVSHDREFAELYADRIIELSDGKVISDVELDNNASEIEMDKISYTGNIIKLPKAYHITEADRKAINDYIQSLSESEVSLEVETKSVKAVRFSNTDESKIKYTDTSAFKLIKSKLPLKNAFKIGCSSLKYKKFRLVTTIFLSVISFILFGLADTFAAYNHVNACTNSLVDTGIDYLSVSKSKLYEAENYEYWKEGVFLSADDIEELEDITGVEMHSVFSPSDVYDEKMSFNYLIDYAKLNENDEGFNIFRASFNGFTAINDDILNEMGCELLSGNLPQKANEIAVSEYIFEIFKKCGYEKSVVSENKEPYYDEINDIYIYDDMGSQGREYEEIKGYSDIIGKTIMLNNNEYIITAIIDTGFDLERYNELTERQENESGAEEIVNYIMFSEFEFAARYSYSGLAMMSEEGYASLIEGLKYTTRIENGEFYIYDGISYDGNSGFISKLSDVKEKITWIDGEKTKLQDNEIIISSDCASDSMFDENGNEMSFLEYCKEKTFGGELWTFGNAYEYHDYKVVGIIESEDCNNLMVTSDKLFDTLVASPDGIYSFAIGSMPSSKSAIKKAVDGCYNYSDNIRYTINNQVTFELDNVNEILKMLSQIFVYIGLGFALFAAIMLSNFIAISITHKKQEIGILRAIGSRSLDVFKIFFAESFVIAMINFVIASVGVGVITAIVNGLLRNEVGFLVTILGFGVRQIALLFAISLLVAAVASFIPVKKIASKKPIDAINNR